LVLHGGVEGDLLLHASVHLHLHTELSSQRAGSDKSGSGSGQVKKDMFNYGKHLGLAFQIVDDILDFTQTEEQLGKPRGQDMASGNLTCPIIFTMQKDETLRDILESEFQEEGSLEEALELVMKVRNLCLPAPAPHVRTLDILGTHQSVPSELGSIVKAAR
jgi:hypothetical protein